MNLFTFSIALDGDKNVDGFSNALRGNAYKFLKCRIRFLSTFHPGGLRKKKCPLNKMSLSFAYFITLTWIAFALVCGVHGSRDPKYNYFDDYLNSLDEEQQAKITGEKQEEEGSGADTDSNQYLPTFNLPLRTGLTRSKDVTCCSLGHLAGDKGYHCVAKFYFARILLRNTNRAHNQKLGFYGRYSVPNYGTKLMRTFEQCVATRGMVFHKCCDHAATEKRVKPHFDSLQRKRYEHKMRRIRIPRNMQVDDKFIGF